MKCAKCGKEYEGFDACPDCTRSDTIARGMQSAGILIVIGYLVWAFVLR
jgi:hypothetical protein